MSLTRTALRLSVLAAAGVQPLAAQSDVAFPGEVYAQRRGRLMREIRDAAVVIPGRLGVGADNNYKQDPDFWYLTGVESPYAILVLLPRSDTSHRELLFLPDRFQFAGGQYPMLDEGFRRAVWNRPRRRLTPGAAAASATGFAETYRIDEFVPRLREIAGTSRIVYTPMSDAVRYAPPGMTAAPPPAAHFAISLGSALPEAELRDVTPRIRRLRLVKDRREIAALRRAAEISAAGMLEGMRALRPGMNDRELAGLMEYVWKREGSPRASFPAIVSSGDHAMTFYSLLRENYNSVDRVMRSGDLVFVDYGAAEHATYTADICRTWPVSGRFTPEQRKYYEIVLEAQEAAIAAVKPGVMMLDVIKAAAHVFRKHGLEPNEDIARMGEDKVWGIMPSPTHYLARNAGIVRYSPLGVGVRDLGHHIGLEVQDSRDYAMPLAPGMVITIEPKIYIPEKTIAIMIEDMILVTATGRENLSAGVPRRASDIERVIAEGRRMNAWRPGGTVPPRRTR
ncbi:MAG: aminopeptidase P N-terminal domain-containing protein [Gemmatimonadaceae bacterium]